MFLHGILHKHTALIEHGHLLAIIRMKLHVMLDDDERLAAVDLAHEFGASCRPRHAFMPAAGSSSRMSSGSVDSTMPSSTHCPLTMCELADQTLCRAGEAYPLQHLVDPPLTRSPAWMRLAASQIFSRTLKPSNTLGTWVLMPMPRRAIWWAWAREIS